MDNDESNECLFGSLMDIIGQTNIYNDILYIENNELVYNSENISESLKGKLEKIGVNERKNLIPIFSKENLKKIGSNESIKIPEAGNLFFYFSESANYILENDINLNCDENDQWIPIDNLKGSFDANWHFIDGIYINNQLEHQGLFRNNEGKICNLTVAGFISCAKGGGIVGHNKGIIEKCINKVEVVGNSGNCGGICSENYDEGIIQYCCNMADISCQNGVAGIAAWNHGKKTKISYCFNKGNIKGYQGSGGIVSFIGSSNELGGTIRMVLQYWKNIRKYC